MRTVASSVDSSSLGAYDQTTVFALTSVAISSTQATQTSTFITATVSGATQYRFAHLINNSNAAGYIGFSAEL
jgi:hypothetical protein